MSRQTIRQAIATFVALPSVAGVGAVYRAEPKRIEAESLRLAMVAGTPTGCVLFPFVQRQEERGTGMGGPFASRRTIVYSVQLVLMASSKREASEDAQDDVDAIIENVLERLRSDPSLGTTGSAAPILVSGLGDTLGAPDLIVEQEPIVRDSSGAVAVIWARIGLTVVEMVTVG